VDGDLGMNFDGEVHTNEIDVADEGLVRMTIDPPDQRRNRLGTVDLEVDHDIRPRWCMEGLREIVVIDCNMSGVGPPAVDHGRYLAGLSQPACRPTAGGATGVGFEIDLSHD
jgi:hypothetical protein